MNQKKNEFNPKITFRFIENIWQKRDHRESEAGIKDVYNKKSLPHSFTEMMFAKALKAYELVCNGEEISMLKIINILKLYKPVIDTSDEFYELISPLVEKINIALKYDCHWLDRWLDIFKFCILCEPFKDYEIEMAKIFSNYSFIVNGKPPIIMYCYSSEKMANIIRYGGDDKELSKTLSLLIKRTEKFNQVHEIINLSDIEEAINSIQEELINDYGVKHLGIFGSFARGEENKYSDLDVVCEVREDFRNIGNLRETIASRIKEVTGLDVDLMIDDVTYDANQIPVDMFSERINLF